MVKKMVVKNPTRPTLQANSMSTISSYRLMISYGSVKSNNTDGTTNIELKTGIVATNLYLPSPVWPSKKPLTGGTKYPPIGSEVLIYHPEGDLDSGYVYPAPLNTKDKEVQDNLLDQGDKELLPGGWEYTYDQETGKMEFKKDTFDLIVDPDGKVVSLTDFEGNTFKNNGAVWEINGDDDFAVAFNDLKAEFNKLNDEYNKLATRLLAWIPVPGDGGAALKVALVVPPSVAVSGSVIDNAKVDNVKFK